MVDMRASHHTAAKTSLVMAVVALGMGVEAPDTGTVQDMEVGAQDTRVEVHAMGVEAQDTAEMEPTNPRGTSHEGRRTIMKKAATSHGDTEVVGTVKSVRNTDLEATVAGVTPEGNMAREAMMGIAIDEAHGAKLWVQ